MQFFLILSKNSGKALNEIFQYCKAFPKFDSKLQNFETQGNHPKEKL